jgi:hypothetical protein
MTWRPETREPIRRVLWNSPTMDKLPVECIDPEAYNPNDWNDDGRAIVEDEQDANLVSSMVPGDGETYLHAPVLDIDYGARLVESSSPGHFHLYLDKVCTWEQYLAVLEAMANAHLIERGYVEAAKRRGTTMVRIRPTKPAALVKTPEVTDDEPF